MSERANKTVRGLIIKAAKSLIIKILNDVDGNP